MDNYQRGRSANEEETIPTIIGIEDVERAGFNKRDRQEMPSISVQESTRAPRAIFPRNACIPTRHGLRWRRAGSMYLQRPGNMAFPTLVLYGLAPIPYTRKVKAVSDDTLIVAVDIGMEMNREYCTTPDGRSPKTFKFDNTGTGMARIRRLPNSPIRSIPSSAPRLSKTHYGRMERRRYSIPIKAASLPPTILRRF